MENQLSRYLAGQSSIAEFHNWLIPAAWDIDGEPESVKRVVYRAQLLLAEFSNGDRPEEELRSEFWNLLNRTSITVTVVFGTASPVYMSNTSIMQGAGIVAGVPPVDMLRVVVPA